MAVRRGGIPIALGVMRFLTTRFRITSTQVELERGLIGRKVLTARLHRVRAVEPTSSPIHRAWGSPRSRLGPPAAAGRTRTGSSLTRPRRRGPARYGRPCCTARTSRPHPPEHRTVPTPTAGRAAATGGSGDRPCAHAAGPALGPLRAAHQLRQRDRRGAARPGGRIRRPGEHQPDERGALGGMPTRSRSSCSSSPCRRRSLVLGAIFACSAIRSPTGASPCPVTWTAAPSTYAGACSRAPRPAWSRSRARGLEVAQPLARLVGQADSPPS